MTICKAIGSLVEYGLVKGLFADEDKVYVTNRLCGELGVSTFAGEGAEDIPLEDILAYILDYAAENCLIPENTIGYRDLFDTKIMNCLLPRPSEVIAKFKADFDESPEKATDNYYAFSKASDYIRTYRIKNDMKWLYSCEYGDIDITINLSKPEKDPKAIAAAKALQKDGAVAYPACQLCKENEGYYGRGDHPARNNHRIIPIELAGEKFFFQYSPYVYYNEHCIILNDRHTEMVIDRPCFDKLLSFVGQYPHYFAGSNADLPIVGGSILTHEHFQGGRYEFAMAKAPVEYEFTFAGFEEITAGIVKWPMSVIRLSGENRERLSELADRILAKWRKYTDADSFIFAETDGVPHNTITPIARMRSGRYELDLVLRNNITTDEYPAGRYHAHPEYHHLKKENIGLIEVMGLAVLPARLKTEMRDLKKDILAGKEITGIHKEWAEDILSRYNVTADNIDEIINNEIGRVFVAILGNCGVFARNEDGRKAFVRFMESV